MSQFFYCKNIYLICESTLTGEVLCAIMYITTEVNVLSITSDLIRGHTETIILAQLMNGDSYGYKINRAIQEKSEDLYELKEATLYTAFRRLEESGCINSYWGDESTGARRRYYTITPYGRREYLRLKNEWENSKRLIDILIL
jgi:Predicted transcriptional regulators